jgi:hypothetical protein
MSAGDGVGFSIDPTTVREWKRYPEYTDSGVAWLGEVPEHWEVKRFKYCVILKSKKISGQETDLPYVGLENIEPWTGQFIQPGEPLLSDGQARVVTPSSYSTGQVSRQRNDGDQPCFDLKIAAGAGLPGNKWMGLSTRGSISSYGAYCQAGSYHDPRGNG